MKLNIGQTIRKQRIEKELTQEELASIFGVSYQTVSRWENGTCYPDMELLPSIAEFFKITVDKLIGADKDAEQKEVKGYLDRFQGAVSQGKVYECIEIARKGVAAYPNNYALLNKLMYALFLSTDEDGNISEWHENQLKYDEEITKLGEKIMKYCPDQDIRLEATSRLAFNHCEMGRKDIGRQIYEALPSIRNCRELAVYWALSEDEITANARELIKSGMDIIDRGIFRLCNSNELSDLEKISVCKKSLALYELIWDNFDYLSVEGYGMADAYCGLARAYARLNDKENAVENIKLTVKYAKIFDERPDASTFTSLLLGETTVNRTDFDTDDTRTLCEIVRDKWLAWSDFDSIRDSSEFKKIIEEL